MLCSMYCMHSCTEKIQLTDVKYLVVDEADTMFDHSFEEATTSIIKTVKVKYFTVKMHHIPLRIATNCPHRPPAVNLPPSCRRPLTVLPGELR